jgi:hypothetical protein
MRQLIGMIVMALAVCIWWPITRRYGWSEGVQFAGTLVIAIAVFASVNRLASRRKDH